VKKWLSMQDKDECCISLSKVRELADTAMTEIAYSQEAVDLTRLESLLSGIRCHLAGFEERLHR